MKAQKLKPCPCVGRDVNQCVLQGNFSPHTPLCTYSFWRNGGREEERGDIKKKEKNKTGAWGQESPRKREIPSGACA